MSVIWRWLAGKAAGWGLKWLSGASLWWAAGVAAAAIAAGGFWAGHTWASGTAAVEQQQRLVALAHAWRGATARFSEEIDTLQEQLAAREQEMSMLRREAGQVKAELDAEKEKDDEVKDWADTAAPGWVNQRLRELSAGGD